MLALATTSSAGFQVGVENRHAIGRYIAYRFWTYFCIPSLAYVAVLTAILSLSSEWCRAVATTSACGASSRGRWGQRPLTFTTTTTWPSPTAASRRDTQPRRIHSTGSCESDRDGLNRISYSFTCSKTRFQNIYIFLLTSDLISIMFVWLHQNSYVSQVFS